MKRIDLLSYLRSRGCESITEGSNHSWWYNESLNKRSSIPKQDEITELLAIKICEDLGVPPLK